MKANDLIKVHKDFTKLNIGTLSEKELELFYFICLTVKDKENRVVELDFSSIKTALGNIRKADLKRYIVGLQQKLASLRITNISEKEISTITLFDKLTNVVEEDRLIIKVTESSLYFFNIANNYLRFLFSDIRKLSGKYAKLLVPYLMEDSHKKEVEFEKDRFFNILEIDEKYKNDLSNFNRIILKPAIEELKTLFENLKVERLKNGRKIVGYKFTWTNDFNFQNRADEIIKTFKNKEKVINIINENINPAGELEQYFKTNFLEVNYTKKHREVLEKLLKNNSIEYIKQYLKDQWEYVQNDNNIKNKPAYFSKLILEEKAVLKDYLPADYEEKKAEENNRNTKGITSLKELVKDITNYEVRKNITPEQIEQQVLLKVDVTEEEYNKIKQDWINKQKEETSNSDIKILETFFNASQSKKYNIIPAEKEETKLNLKYTKEVYEGKIKKTEYQIEFYKKELFKIMEDDDLELEELEEKRKYIEDKIENYKIKIEDYKKEILKLKEEKIKK